MDREQFALDRLAALRREAEIERLRPRPRRQRLLRLVLDVLKRVEHQLNERLGEEGGVLSSELSLIGLSGAGRSIKPSPSQPPPSRGRGEKHAPSEPFR